MEAKWLRFDHSGHSFTQTEKIGGNAIAFKRGVADEAQVKKTVDDSLKQSIRWETIGAYCEKEYSEYATGSSVIVEGGRVC